MKNLLTLLFLCGNFIFAEMVFGGTITITPNTYLVTTNGVYDVGEPFIDVPNGVYDEGEPFIDALNGIWNEGEVFTDIGNRQYNEGEIFIDSNGNGVWDDAEYFEDGSYIGEWLYAEGWYPPNTHNGYYDLDEFFIDENGNGIWDDAEEWEDNDGNGVYDVGEPFVDALNGVWDEGEVFADVGNGVYDEGEEFTDFIPMLSLASYNSLVAEKEAALVAKANAEAERDARPTQNAYDALVAENSEKYNLKDIADLREGSKMIAISNGEATISMEVEKSDELGTWAVEGNLSTTISVEPGEDKKFFRFKMNNSDLDGNDITLSVGDTEYDEAAIKAALAEQYGVPIDFLALEVTNGN